MTYNLSASKRDDSTHLHFDPNNQEEQFQNDHSGKLGSRTAPAFSRAPLQARTQKV